MDAGSAILASVVATVVFLLVLTALRRAGRTELDVVFALGNRVAGDPPAAFVAGIVAIVSIGAVEALALAAVWGGVWSTLGPAAWPIAPPQGALMTIAQWPLARHAVRDLRGGPLALFLAMLAYGVTLGMVYVPGI